MRERARGTERERASVFFSISNGTNATFVEQISLFFPLREREETTRRKRGYNLSNPLLESLLSHPDENENENDDDDDDDDATHHPPTFERKARRPSLLAQNRGGRRQERKIDRSARIIIESGDDVYDVNDDDDVPPRFFILCYLGRYV